MASKTETKSKYETQFECLEKIGEGGFGIVVKAKEYSTGSFFAIKRVEIKSDLIAIMKEISLLSQLKSPFVVDYIDSWDEIKVIDKDINKFVYIQMELCSQNLESIINSINTSFDDRFKTIKYFIRSKLFVEIIECLNYLHSLETPIIHRDLKPQNILVTDGTNGRILKLCDFGLSKSLENSRDQTRGVGTTTYMAPEINDPDYYNSELDRSHYNMKCDIYSLGVIATKLFDLKGSVKTFRKLDQMKGKNSAVHSNTCLEEKCPKLLEIISKMLSKIPEKRLSCSELLDKTHEWTVDTNTVRNDENCEEFIRIMENNDKLKVLQKLF